MKQKILGFLVCLILFSSLIFSNYHFIPICHATSTWISPTGYSDPSLEWQNEQYAYDDNVDSYAITTHMVDPHTWAAELYLTVSSINCSKIRIYCNVSIFPSSTTVNISVYKGGTWTEVYSGPPNDYGWQEVSFTQGIVTQAEIEIYNGLDVKDYEGVIEFDFWRVETEPSTISITLATNPSGCNVSLDGGTWYSAPHTWTGLTSGNSHSIQAQSPYTITANQERYVWASWNDSGANPHSVSPTVNTTYTATMTHQWCQNASSSYGTPSNNGVWYNNGATASSSVTTPVSGGTGIRYANDHHTGTGSCPTGTGSSVSYTITSYSTVTFDQWVTQYYFSVTSTYDSPTGQGWYDSGTTTVYSSVTSPSSGHNCIGWTGTGSCPASGSTTNTGTFTINQYSTCIWLWSSPYGSGTVQILFPTHTYFGLPAYGTYITFNTQKTFSNSCRENNYWYFDGYGFQVQAANITITDYFQTATNILKFSITAPSETTSTTKIYVSNKGQPSTIIGATSSSYDIPTKILTMHVSHHSTANIELQWGITPPPPPPPPTPPTEMPSDILNFLHYLWG